MRSSQSVKGRRPCTGAVLAIAGLCVGLELVRTAAAFAEEGVATASTATLAREFSDPLTTLPQVFLQDSYTPTSYGTKAETNRVTARVFVPRIPRFSLLPFVQLVRSSAFLVTVPTGRGSRTRTEFGDMQLFDLAVLPWPSRESGWLIGVGPMFVFPTATHRTAGQGAWQVGPAFGAMYKGVPSLLAACLVQNPISFAYTSGDRQRQSALLVQPILLLHVARGWYVKSDSMWTIGWGNREPTLLPLSFGVGYVTVREGLPPINLFVSGEWTVYRQFAPVAPQTTVRFGMTMGLPWWRPW